VTIAAVEEFGWISIRQDLPDFFVRAGIVCHNTSYAVIDIQNSYDII
jgi:hypothetical protein